jgi:uncharacterized membrane protein AbrB (regulator of aidB expression)
MTGYATVALPIGQRTWIERGSTTWLLLVRLGLRAGWMLGPLAFCAALTASGHVISGVPWWLSAIAQVALGAQLGAAFDRPMLSRLRRFVPAAMLHVVLLMLGGVAAFGVMRRRKGSPAASTSLNQDETAALDRILSKK